MRRILARFVALGMLIFASIPAQAKQYSLPADLTIEIPDNCKPVPAAEKERARAKLQARKQGARSPLFDSESLLDAAAQKSASPPVLDANCHNAEGVITDSYTARAMAIRQELASNRTQEVLERLSRNEQAAGRAVEAFDTREKSAITAGLKKLGLDVIWLGTRLENVGTAWAFVSDYEWAYRNSVSEAEAFHVTIVEIWNKGEALRIEASYSRAFPSAVQQHESILKSVRLSSHERDQQQSGDLVVAEQNKAIEHVNCENGIPRLGFCTTTTSTCKCYWSQMRKDIRIDRCDAICTQTTIAKFRYELAHFEELKAKREAEKNKKMEEAQKEADAERHMPANELLTYYTSYQIVRRCYDSRREYAFVFVTESDVNAARAAMTKIEQFYLAKDASLDKDGLWNQASSKLDQTEGGSIFLFQGKNDSGFEARKKACGIHSWLLLQKLKEIDPQANAIKKDF